MSVDLPSLRLSAAHAEPAPLLLDIFALAALLTRSVPSLRRDDASGRIPVGLRIGAAKRWRTDEIRRWVDAGCPDREKWLAMEASTGGQSARFLD